MNTEILAKALDADLEDWAAARGDRRSDGDPRTRDIAVFPVGWKGTWDIHETVRKVYSIF